MQTKFPTVGLRRPALLLFLIAASATWAATAKPDPALAAQARKLLADSGVQGGLVVHLGCGAGALTAALRVDGRYLVHGLDPDPANVQAARTHIRSLGLYGPVSVAPLTGKRLPYTSDLVNLLVVSGAHGVSQAEMLRVLAPRGVALRRKGYGWMPTVKPCPDDVDDWTHLWHGPDNNGVAMDARVGPPRHLKWKSAPLWCRSHDGVPSSVPIVLSANGRLLSLIDEGLTGQPSLPQRWTLVMRDGYNGVLLWRKRLPGRVSTKALAAVGDRVYLIPNRRSPLTVLDAATGKPLMTCAGTENANEFVCSAGIVALHAKGARKSSDGKDSVILGVDAKTGKTLWKTPSAPVTPETLTATDDAVFAQTGKSLVCLGLRDGAQRWTVPVKGSGKGGALMVYRGAVIASPSGALQVYAAEDGKLLWKGPRANKRLGVFGASGLVWVTSINEGGRTFLWTPAPTVSSGRDPRTGEVKRTVSVPFLASPGHHIRCYSAKATDRYLLLPKRGVEFVDLQGENHMRHDWLRGSCRHGVIAANGLLYAPPHQCFCYPGVKLAGYNAVSADVGEETAPAGEALERGPAYGKLTTRNSQLTTPSDWPMYRHDARRSGRAACDVPPSPQTLWKRDLSGVLTQPIVVDGRLVVADKDAHTIHCMAADTGKDLWTHVAGGRIDSPPTGHRGAVLFGSTDGFVTCLRASDGVVAWRFRAAPRDRRIVVFDQLESPWPVHGSVLVQNGVVYCTAGRSSFLDGGLWVYGLNAKTGEIAHEAHLANAPPNVMEEAGRPFDMDGARSDLLVSDGEDIYLFQLRFSPSLSRKETPRITKLGDREVGLHLMSNAGFLDTAGFDRSYWTYSRRWPGYYFGYNAPKTGQILVFDDAVTYGLHVFATRQGHSPRFHPGKDGYILFADDNDNRPILRPTAIGREKGSGFSPTLPSIWSVRAPVHFNAMVLAGDRLIAAGAPDVVPEDDAYAAVEGRKGAKLWVISTEDGKRLSEVDLEHPPVFDGMIAAGGRLYVAMQNGRLLCLGAK